mmetsp:Transcript_35451/g.110895  ORF Transcript_35451/g.110895 Transcript_35451/m.110895 type:complete len:174 (-) Transcript_35451:65-586(-)
MITVFQNKKGFNLFEGLEHMIEGTVFNDTATASGKNKETVQEKKQEKEKEERKWGLMGLGKDNVTGENQNMKPWYALRQSEEAASYEGYGQAVNAFGSLPFTSKGSKDKSGKDEKKKLSEDPMKEISHFVSETRKHKHMKHKKKERGHSSSSKDDSAAKIEALRAERVARQVS